MPLIYPSRLKPSASRRRHLRYLTVYPKKQIFWLRLHDIVWAIWRQAAQWHVHGNQSSVQNRMLIQWSSCWQAFSVTRFVTIGQYMKWRTAYRWTSACERFLLCMLEFLGPDARKCCKRPGKVLHQTGAGIWVKPLSRVGPLATCPVLDCCPSVGGQRVGSTVSWRTGVDDRRRWRVVPGGVAAAAAAAGWWLLFVCMEFHRATHNASPYRKLECVLNVRVTCIHQLYTYFSWIMCIIL